MVRSDHSVFPGREVDFCYCLLRRPKQRFVVCDALAFAVAGIHSHRRMMVVQDLKGL